GAFLLVSRGFATPVSRRLRLLRLLVFDAGTPEAIVGRSPPTHNRLACFLEYRQLFQLSSRENHQPITSLAPPCGYGQLPSSLENQMKAWRII
ncbi:MAG: hypothetical protein ACLFMU_07485, partial [Bacteroidales bacterium]